MLKRSSYVIVLSTVVERTSVPHYISDAVIAAFTSLYLFKMLFLSDVVFIFHQDLRCG